jgi:hypothetical protein
MTTGSPKRLLRSMVVLYRGLLFALPNDFRRDYGGEMVRLFEDRARDVLKQRSGAAMTRFVLHVAADWFATALCERTAAVGEGMRINATLGVLCLFNVAAGCWLGVMEAVLRHPAFEQRMVIAGLIAGQSVLTLLVISGSANRVSRTVAGAGAGGLFVLGSLAVLKNINGRDFEGFAVVIGLALVAQALLTFWATYLGRTITPLS